MTGAYKTQAHNVALHPDDLHHVKVSWQGEQKTLAELTPPECRALVEHCIGKAAAASLLQGIECWDSMARFYSFNDLAQRGKLKKVLA